MSKLVEAINDYHEFKTQTYPEYKKLINSPKEADSLEAELSDYFEEVKNESKNASTEDFAEALNVACEFGYRDIVELLLNQAGTSPLWDDQNNPILSAFLNDHVDIIRLLMSNDNIRTQFEERIKNSMGDELLAAQVAASLSEDRFYIFLSREEVMNSVGINPTDFQQYHLNYLEFAARNGLTEFVPHILPNLLMDGRNTIFKIDQAIYQAAQHHHAQMVGVLLDARKKAQPIWNDIAILYDAFCQGETEFIIPLLENETICAALLRNIQEGGVGKNGVDFALRVAALSMDKDKKLLKEMLKEGIVQNYLLNKVNKGNDYLTRLALAYAEKGLTEQLTSNFEPTPARSPKQGLLTYLGVAEWEAAKKYFADNPLEIKFKKKGKDGHSFIKVDDAIYAISSHECLGGRKPGTLGEGGFGKVKVAQTESGENFAIKVEGATLKEDSDAELQIMRILKFTHGQAVRKIPEKEFKGKSTKTKLYTIMELVEGKELQKRIFENKLIENLNEEQRIGLALACCQAIQFLHDHRIVHGDIKPANFMANGEGDNIVIGAIDFGLSTILAADKDFIIKEKKGSEGYTAPEIDARGEFSFQSDVYALGKMLQNDFRIPEHIIKEMIEVDPKKRCSLMVVIEDLNERLKTKNEKSLRRSRTVTSKHDLRFSKEKQKLAKQENKENRNANRDRPKT